MNGEGCIWPNEDISEYELFLVSKGNEILDHFSSSFLPNIAGPMRSETEFAKQVQQAISAGENEHTEFKVYIDLKDSGKAKEIEKTVCAFSNKSGGYLIIGVADDGSVKGFVKEVGRGYQGNKDSYFDAICKRLTEKLRLPNCYNAKFVEVLGETLLVLHVKAVDDCNFVLDDNIAFIRRGATSARATPEECARLYATKRSEGGFLTSLIDKY
jgi:predicted HTH transcriptional regulator